MFAEELTVTLTLAGGSTTAVVAAGDVERLDVVLHAWGFEAEVTLSTWPELAGDDPVLPLLTGAGLVKARLEVAATRAPTPPPDPLLVTGLVTNVAIVEHTTDPAQDRPVRRREVTVRFADPAQVLWRQHHPSELSADITLGEVIDRQVVEGIVLERSWSRLDQEQAIVCLACGAEDAGFGGASFYDFLMWYVDLHAGAFTFDATTARYSLAAAKPGASGTPGLLDPEGFVRARVVAPDPARHQVKLLDAHAAAPASMTVTDDLRLAAVRRDVLALPPTPDHFDDLKTVEAGRLAASSPGPTLELELARFPTVTLRPGVFVKTPPADRWLASAAAGLPHRVVELRLAASARAVPGHESGHASRVYDASGRALLERGTDAARRLPPYVAPRYPIHAEGRVIAAGGEETDRRWQVLEDGRTGGSVYTVEVVLWNAKVVVPFLPDQQPGQLFFPAYKNSTVLVELWLHEGWLCHHLDWGPDVRLPQDGQGDHILLGFNATSHTTLAHTYVDQKPELLIKRLESGDQQSIALREGVLTLLVKEDAVTGSTTPTYDVSLQVETARGELTGKIGGGIGEVSTKFGGAAAGLSGAIGGASAEVQGALQSTTGEVGARLQGAKGELGALRAGLSEGPGPVVSAAAQAKAELLAAAE